MTGDLPDRESGYVFRDRYPERTEVYHRFDEASAAARATLRCVCDLPYGAHPREVFDLFSAGQGAPLVVFVHGGYWQSLDKTRYSFVAAALVRSGFSVALPNYPLSPDATMERIVESIGGCLPAILSALRAPPPFWIASGHSAGGHLAATLAMTTRLESTQLAACVPISGVFDVEPLVETSLNVALRLDRLRAAKLSPIHQAPPPCMLAAIVGADETPAFLGQSRGFVEHWRRSGQNTRLVSMPARNHYTILCDMLEERSEIAQEVTRTAEAFRQRGS
ncbi:alpha/beta hydrolase [Mesorhizobium tamadayense]|uniref:Alpha/beta hydrolase n=1 Tax=Mesorhizobium tamadayense TaxID=425306 RepID=A0A3P3EZL5_9HYPH|nr:alpha/beta hydrolase [Mesorhizobium tamadayense]RRH91814.1 alpha/beta hydrolase [Mesorhizobium tamadayense]